MIQENIKDEFNFSDLFISWLIGALIIIGLMNLKANYELYKQEQKTLQAMNVAVKLDEEKKKLSKQKDELGAIIALQKNWYQNEISKRDKYENIIKDIDRTWTEKSK